MKPKELILFFLLLFAVTVVFFYKVFLFGQIPFPGDLLTTSAPYKTQSFLGYAPGGYPNKAQDPDVLYEIYPWRYFAIDQIKHGQIPFWNPHNFSGNLQMQNYQTAVFYPLNVLYFILPFNIAWTIIILSQPLLAGLFMYLFLRSLNLDMFASGIGSITFAFSSYMTVWLEYGNIGSTILWLPLLLYLVKRWSEKKQVRYFLFFIGAMFAAFLAGYIQGVFYLYIVSFAYFVYLIRHEKTGKRFFAPTILMFVLPIFLVSFQLIPTIVLFAQSTRSAYSLKQIETNLQPVWYVVTMLVPDFFGNPATRNMWVPLTYIERIMYPGILTMFFALYSLMFAKNKEKSFFAILAGLFLLLTTNLPGIKYLYLLPIPVISTTVPTRALSIVIFSLIVLATIGIDCWLKQEFKVKKTIWFAALFAGLYLMIWASIFIIPKLFPNLAVGLAVTKRNMILPTCLAIGALIVFYMKQYYMRISLIVLSVLVFIDLFYFFVKITPFAPYQLVYPQTPVISYLQQHASINRFWGYGDAYIPSNIQSVDKTYSPEGNDPLHLKDYGILLQSSKDGQYPDVLPRPDANIVPGYGTDDLRNNKYRQAILNLLGVKYVLNLNNNLQRSFVPDPAFPEGAYQLIWQQNPWQIYENKQALPRFFLKSNYVVVNNAKDSLNKIYTVDLANTIILDKQPDVKPDFGSTGFARLIKYNSNEVFINSSANGNALLFLSDNYYPSWKATIDRKEAQIYKADFSFRAVEVPKGKHVVRFYYDPMSFKVGLIAAGIGLIMTIFAAFYIKRYDKKI